MCDVILTFVLVFLDGHKESREKWVDHNVAQFMIGTLKSNNFKKEYNIKTVEDIKVTTVDSYDCFKGPKK